MKREDGQTYGKKTQEPRIMGSFFALCAKDAQKIHTASRINVTDTRAEGKVTDSDL